MRSLDKFRKNMTALCAATIVTILGSSCTLSTATNPTRNEGQFKESIFRHQIFFFEGERSSNTLTIFIEGDGRPWIDQIHVARDPTQSQLLMLELARLSSTDVLYLGRPCYHGVKDEMCHYRFWTSHRYSPEVVASMVQLAGQRLEAGSYQKLILVGHSGGGALASLMACSFSVPTLLVTLSANLDTEAWARHHDWTPLQGSLNPATASLQCPWVTHHHFQGGEDENTPPWTNDRYFLRHDTQPDVIPDAGHNDWAAFWPLIETVLTGFIEPE